MRPRLLLVFVAALVKPLAAASRNAYVTIHYEGTDRDPEYVLGIRVLMQSLRATGTTDDIVVLASDTVSEASRETFRRDGAVVKQVPNIENPFATGRRRSFKEHFKFTLNKLYLWNMTEYERVIYLDADNVAMRSMDYLFRCGSFCVVFMNPCHFHTGLMVVKPDTSEFNRLLRLLGTAFSYDGADQGFLSYVYGDTMLRAPLFSPDQPAYDRPQRLAPQENSNHIWFYEANNLDILRFGRFADLDFPATSIAYPIMPIAKVRTAPSTAPPRPFTPSPLTPQPWYWLPYLFFPLHWRWHEHRDSLHEDYSVAIAWRAAVILPAAALLARVVAAFWSRGLLDRPIRAVRWVTDLHWSAASAVGVAGLLLTLVPGFLIISPLLPPRAAWTLFVALQHASLAVLVGVMAHDTYRPMRRWAFSPSVRRWLKQLDRMGFASMPRPPGIFACVLALSMAWQALAFTFLDSLVQRLACFFFPYALHAWMLQSRIRASQRRKSVSRAMTTAPHSVPGRDRRISSEYLDLPMAESYDHVHAS